MKKYLLLAMALVFSLYMFGCKKEDASMQEAQEPAVSMETLSTVNTEMPTAGVLMPEARMEFTQAMPAPAASLEALPPSGPYRPKATEIQAALKNANYYTGAVDGKIGPMTKKAIEEFQKANGLQADGKVGPKTWEMLSKYMNIEVAPGKKGKRR
ncbi:MAG: peptidoglycan-binding domain-containing protein [Candidatus Omnitrophota bacterium]